MVVLCGHLVLQLKKSCTYSNNSAGNNGGAVYTSVGGVTLIIADTNFTGNTAVNSGAAVF
jgi:predicted outer membrane repeat protein